MPYEDEPVDEGWISDYRERFGYPLHISMAPNSIGSETECFFPAMNLSLVAAPANAFGTMESFLLNAMWNAVTQEEGFYVYFSNQKSNEYSACRLISLNTTQRCKLSAKDVFQYLRAMGSKSEVEEPICLGNKVDTLRSIQDAILLINSYVERFSVIDAAGWRADEIAAHVEVLRKTKPVRGVFVDCLESVRPPFEWEHSDFRLRVERAAEYLKDYAIHARIPVVAGIEFADQYNNLGCSDKDHGLISFDSSLPQGYLRDGWGNQFAGVTFGLFRAVFDDESYEVTPGDYTPLLVAVLKDKDRCNRAIEKYYAFDPTRGKFLNLYGE